MMSRFAITRSSRKSLAYRFRMVRFAEPSGGSGEDESGLRHRATSAVHDAIPGSATAVTGSNQPEI